MDAADAIGKLLIKNNLHVVPEAASQLVLYQKLLEKWNGRMNLTASTQWPSLEPLFDEAFWAARFQPSAGRRLDIGSGAGFPALPLRIVSPSLSLDLVESRAKRAIFLETVVEALELTGVRVHSERLATLLARCPEKPCWDWVSWKAIRLSPTDLTQVVRRIEALGQIWMFHGRDLPVEEADSVNRSLELVRRERYPLRSQWYLSIYSAPQTRVSRET